MVGKMSVCLSVCVSVEASSPITSWTRSRIDPNFFVASAKNEYGVKKFGPIGVGPRDGPIWSDPAKRGSKHEN